jgi:ATP-dependent DNA ligase
MTNTGAEVTEFALPVDLPPMEAHLVEELPEEPGWQFEPKWDGFRCLAFRAGNEVELRAKSGKPLARYFPEMSAALRGFQVSRFVLDGELAIPVGETFAFEALQMRLHPAESRIKKLAAEIPAVLILFDLLRAPDGERLLQTPLIQRRSALDAFFQSIRREYPVRLSPYTRNIVEARGWLDASCGALEASSPSGSRTSIGPASEPCSRLRSGGPRIAWSGASATRRTRTSSGLSCSASTTMKASSIMSGLLRHCTISTMRR